MDVTSAVIGALIGMALGAVLAWLIADRKRQTDLNQVEQARVRAETLLAEAQKDVEEQTDRFKAAALEVFQMLSPTLLEQHRAQLETLMTKADGDLTSLVQPLQEALKRYEDQIHALEEARQTAYGSLNQQLQELNRETDALVRTLRAPQMRGAWGELTLRRVVELAGLSEHYDFLEQATVSGAGGSQRPDLLVTLPGERTIVVDAKAPMDAYFEAAEATDEAAHKAALSRHAKQVRQHVQTLASRDYTLPFGDNLDLVCLFLPGESFFSAAIEQDQELLSWAMQRRVLLCSPASLVALLRTVGLFWQKHEVVENADQIAEASRELFKRISTFVQHFARLGKSLKAAEEAYNDAVGSYQGRVLPAGRRVTELKGAQLQAEAEELESVEVALRPLPDVEEGTHTDS